MWFWRWWRAGKPEPSDTRDFHARRLARRLEDPEFRAEYERQLNRAHEVDKGWLEPPYAPQTLPAWACTECGQLNSGWSWECGRCERVPVHVVLFKALARDHSGECIDGDHVACSDLTCECACHVIDFVNATTAEPF